MSIASDELIHVVAAVIRDENGKILIAKRPNDTHQGGKWEFPGGKVEVGESAKEALCRELDEEIGIQVIEAHPLINVRHDYPDKSVLLDVWEVVRFSGNAYGKEGQPVAWVTAQDLQEYEFPQANTPIITAAQLPNTCFITPEPRHESDFLGKLESVLESGTSLVQFRAKELSNADYMDLARQVIQIVHKYPAKVLLNSPPLWIKDADGMHLSSQILTHTPFRPSMEQGKMVTASCHNQNELEKAAYIQADAVFLSPVRKTASHPTAEPLGWKVFQELIEKTNIPVYALGGVKPSDITKAREHGAQGVAAISSIWQS